MHSKERWRLKSVLSVLLLLVSTACYADDYPKVETLLSGLDQKNPIVTLHRDPVGIYYHVSRGDCSSFNSGVKLLIRSFKWADYPPDDRATKILIDDLAKYLSWNETRFERCAFELDSKNIESFVKLYSGEYRKFAPDFESIAKRLSE